MGILNRLTGLLGGGKKVGVAQVVQALLEQFGGIDGLMAKLESSGLSQQLSSWVGTGENAQVGAKKIEDALGSDVISGVAQKLGIDHKEAAARVSVALPKVIDRLTPAGKLPEGGISMDSVMNLLGGIRER
ncbi:MAG: YidB family protein [Acidimicrobiia bacterium]